MHGAGDIEASLSLAWALPFVGLLLTIAVAPLVASRLWHHHYGKAVAIWTLAFVIPDAFSRGPYPALAAIVAAALHEYLPFVLLLGTLFAVAGGILVRGTPRGSPAVNVVLLALGTLLASVIGTTGAAMVMIRPLIRANRRRRPVAHVFVFFIILVANVGGGLSPIGDPPLFLGYLLGVPFFWPTVHLAPSTFLLAAILLTVFYALDVILHRRHVRHEPEVLEEIEKLSVEGKINFVLLAATIAVVISRAFWSPSLGLDIFGVHWALDDMVSDGLLFVVGTASMVLTRKTIRRANEFSWGPMIEVAIIFAGIFVTLVPVMAMIAAGEHGPAAPLIAHLFRGGAPQANAFYWLTGALSSVLDNAPTYVVFFGFAGGDPVQLTGVLAKTLMAISTGAVYFGAMTYIGNAPNFMVKAIVENHGIRMPSFFAYVGWSALCLLPWLFVVDFLFFR